MHLYFGFQEPKVILAIEYKKDPAVKDAGSASPPPPPPEPEKEPEPKPEPTKTEAPPAEPADLLVIVSRHISSIAFLYTTIVIGYLKPYIRCP